MGGWMGHQIEPRYQEPESFLHGDGHKLIPSSGGREELLVVLVDGVGWLT